MLKGFIKPVGFVLSGILCVQLSVFAADTETKKPKKSKSAPKTEAQTDTKAEAKPEIKPPVAAEAKPEAKAETKPAAEAKKEDGDGKVVATVNGENIYQKKWIKCCTGLDRRCLKSKFRRQQNRYLMV